MLRLGARYEAPGRNRLNLSSSVGSVCQKQARPTLRRARFMRLPLPRQHHMTISLQRDAVYRITASVHNVPESDLVLGKTSLETMRKANPGR